MHWSILLSNSLRPIQVAPQKGAINPAHPPATKPRADDLSMSTQTTKFPRAAPKETRNRLVELSEVAGRSGRRRGGKRAPEDQKNSLLAEE